MSVRIIPEFIAHAFVWDYSVRGILCSLGGEFSGIFCGHLFMFFPENLSLPLASCIVYVLLLGVKTPGGVVLRLIWFVL